MPGPTPRPCRVRGGTPPGTENGPMPRGEEADVRLWVGELVQVGLGFHLVSL